MREVDKMSEKNEIKSNKNKSCDRKTQEKDEHKNEGTKCNWKGVFEDVTYSSGPGDNIFIFG